MARVAFLLPASAAPNTLDLPEDCEPRESPHHCDARSAPDEVAILFYCAGRQPRAKGTIRGGLNRADVASAARASVANFVLGPIT